MCRVGDALIVTALLDDETQQRFDRLRRRHFPPERNHLDAHLTLFHHLPGDRAAAIAEDLAAVAGRATGPLPVRISGLRFTGRGVGYVLSSPGLVGLRAALAARWDPWLTPQDRAKGSDLHVTVQNKVEPDVARALHDELRAEFVPSTATAVGLAWWRYLDGPWEPVGRHVFGAGEEISGPRADAGPAPRTSGTGRARRRRREQG